MLEEGGALATSERYCLILRRKATLHLEGFRLQDVENCAGVVQRGRVKVEHAPAEQHSFFIRPYEQGSTNLRIVV